MFLKPKPILLDFGRKPVSISVETWERIHKISRTTTFTSKKEICKTVENTLSLIYMVKNHKAIRFRARIVETKTARIVHLKIIKNKK